MSTETKKTTTIDPAFARRTARLLRDILMLFRECSDQNIPATQIVSFMHAASATESLSIRDFAKALGVNRTLVTLSLQSLSTGRPRCATPGADLVGVHESPHDATLRDVKLTPKGEDLMHCIAKLVRQFVEKESRDAIR